MIVRLRDEGPDPGVAARRLRRDVQEPVGAPPRQHGHPVERPRHPAGVAVHGLPQARRRVAGGQDYEVRYEAKKTGASAAEVKRTVKSVGNARKKVEKALGN